MNEALTFLTDWGGWSWLIAAALLILVDLAAPGLYLVWFGLAAGATGIVTFATGMTWAWQLATFSAASVAALIMARSLFSPLSAESGQPFLNQRAQQLVGQVFILDEPISGGRGKVRVGDTLWKVNGPDLDAGSRIIVTGAEGSVLTVEAEAAPNLPKAGSFG